MRIAAKLTHHFSNMPKDISKTQFSKLNNRSLLIVNGPQTRKLIQGLITNDVRELKPIQYQSTKTNRVGLYALFLQQKGKVLSDAFIIQPRIYKDGKAVYAEDELWIDIPKQAKVVVRQHIKKHMWKKQVELHDVEQGDQDNKPSVYTGTNQDNEVPAEILGGSVELDELQQGQDGAYANLVFFDPRGSKFGIRVISVQSDMAVAGHYEQRSQSESNLIRQQLGQIPFELCAGRLPFQFNFDLMNGISLKKGCYLGQEVVSRGLMTGIIRRRIFPFVIHGTDEALPENTILRGENNEQLGKVLACSNKQGLALVNYIPFVENKTSWPVHFTSPVCGSLVNPFANQLQRYYEDIKHKQKILTDLDL